MVHHLFISSLFLVTVFCSSLSFAKEIIHDAEYYISEAQNGEKWAADDKIVDEMLTEFREKNGG